MTQEELSDFVVLYTQTVRKLEDYQKWYEKAIGDKHRLERELAETKKQLVGKTEELELRILQVENLQDDIANLRFELGTLQGFTVSNKEESHD